MKRKSKETIKARKFIAHKIKKNYTEGRSLKQSVAIAFTQARKKGYKVPKR